MRVERSVVAVGLGAVALTGCGWWGSGSGPGPSPSPDAAPTEAADPCPDVPEVDLGSPYRGGDVARFAVPEPTRLWISARVFPSGGIFDPEVGRTAISIGSASELPTYDEQRSTVTGVEASVDVVEDTWSAVDLDAGGHWLWSSTGGGVVLKSCEGVAVTDVVPVDPDDRVVLSG